jgi:hypothetical protein
MGKKIGEFFVDITVDAMSGNLSVRQLISAMGDLEAASLGGAIGITKAVDKFVDMAKGAMDAATGLEMLRALTGENTTTLQKWTKAAEATKIGADTVVTGLRGYQNLMAQMGRTGVPPDSIQRFFAITGVSVLDAKGKARDYFEVLKDLADPSKGAKFWALDKTMGGRAQTLTALQELGGDERTMRLLELMQSGEFGKAMGGAPVLSEKQIKDLAQVSRDFGQIGNLMQSITQNLMLWGGKLHELLQGVIGLLEDVNKLIPGKQSAEEFRAKHGVISGALTATGLDKLDDIYKGLSNAYSSAAFILKPEVGMAVEGKVDKLDVDVKVKTVGPDGRAIPATAEAQVKSIRNATLQDAAIARGPVSSQEKKP